MSTFLAKIFGRLQKNIVSLQRQKVNRLFRLVVIDLGF